MAPANRSKSPPKGVRQADPSPKRLISNDTINTERLKVARDEAEKAMKVRNQENESSNELFLLLSRTIKYSPLLDLILQSENRYDGE